MLYYFLPENQFQMIKSHVVRFTIAAGLILSTIFYISHFFHWYNNMLINKGKDFFLLMIPRYKSVMVEMSYR